MSEFDDMADRDERVREPKDGEYCLKSVGTGSIVCTRPGLRLIDFYRTSDVLAKDQPTPHNMKGGQV